MTLLHCDILTEHIIKLKEDDGYKSYDLVR